VRVLEREFETGYGVVCRHLRARQVFIDVDGEHSSISSDGRKLHVRAERYSDTRGGSVTRVSLGRAVLSDLLEGRSTLVDSALAGRFDLLGSPDDVLVFHDALMAYFASAARCASFPALLDAFLENP
jgi:hypothetical protein